MVGLVAEKFFFVCSTTLFVWYTSMNLYDISYLGRCIPKNPNGRHPLPWAAFSQAPISHQYCFGTGCTGTMMAAVLH